MNFVYQQKFILKIQIKASYIVFLDANLAALKTNTKAELVHFSCIALSRSYEDNVFRVFTHVEKL